MSGYVNVDLFAGVGGFHLAWKRHHVKTMWASEWHASSADTYAKNFGFRPSGDITGIPASDIPPHTVLSAGFPCQAFSVSGKQRGFADTRGTLFFDVARIATHHQPEMVLLENVRNFATHDHGRTLRTVLTTLNSIGYDTHWKVLTASDFGVPQHRQRIYIVGFHKDLNVGDAFQWPVPQLARKSLGDLLLSPPDVPTETYVTRSDLVLDTTKIASLDAQTNPAPTPQRVGFVGKGGQGERVYHHRGTSITLSAHGGGVGAKTGLYYTPEGKVRKLAPREAARLMGFPDTYSLHPSTSQALQHFGNAVVVDVVDKVASEMLTALRKAPTRSTRTGSTGSP